MANGTTSDFQDCTLQPFEKNRYFYSKLLTVSDFEVEQRYGISKDRLIHRLIHGHGINYGVEVSEIALNAQNKLAVKLTEGAALDCCGNEIIVPARGNAIEVKEGDYSQDGTYYLYLKYAECQKDPMPQLANGSSCEESCCYSRIQETFTLAIAKTPTTTISGKVIEKGITPQKPIANAKIISFSTDGNIQGITTTNATGDYQLPVFDNQAYDIKASASGYQSQTKRLSVAVTQNIELVKTTPDCQKTTENYEETYLKAKSKCTDPKVLIAVFTITAGQPKVDDSQTKTFRSVIYSNPMLHDLLCDHIGDLDNPHETTAAQVKALQSVNGVGNVSGQPYTSNIDLVSLDNKIRISPPDSPPGPPPSSKQINLSLEDQAIERRHLSTDVINNLITSNGTITIVPTDTAGNTKTIELSTSALQLGAMVSVNRVQNVNGDVTLQSADGSIVVDASVGAGLVGLTVNPGTNILSVRTAPAPGTAAKFAREDHVHNLEDRVVTGPKIAPAVVTRATHLAPDITDLLTSTDNSVTITPNARARTINLAVNQAPPGNGIAVPTGSVIFQRVGVGELRSSPDIEFGIDWQPEEGQYAAIVLALESKEEVFIGDLELVQPTREVQAPLMMATYKPGAKVFQITVQDQRTEGRGARDYQVRWWAIPRTEVRTPPVEVPPPQ